MDDFVASNLHEARSEWAARLIAVLSPHVQEGIQSIFEEAWKMCIETQEPSKYLMTFQNLLCAVPKWNANITSTERLRIVEKSGCNYLEELIACVHVIQLKILTCIRVANQQKKIDLSIPKVDAFIHKVYINIARKVYSNVYLFDKNVTPLQGQKHKRELELIIQESILAAVRESIPTEEIIRAYLSEVDMVDELVIQNEQIDKNNEVISSTTTPVEVEQPTFESTVETMKESLDVPLQTPASAPEPAETVPSFSETLSSFFPSTATEPKEMSKGIQFNDFDMVLTPDGEIKTEHAPKDVQHLEQISLEKALQRQREQEEENRAERIQIMSDSAVDINPVSLDTDIITLA
jgi:hypothetical protein